MKLLGIDTNAKLKKNKKKGYLTGGLHLAPEKLSGYQTCASATPGCKAACLNTAGRGAFSTTQAARIRKTVMFFENRPEFMLQLEKEIVALIKKAAKEGLTPAIRLNVVSDIRWEKVRYTGASGQQYANLMERFPDVQFYDYTKHSNRKDVPKNYHLTFSLAENNDRKAKNAIKNGMNIAAVFKKDLPKRYFGLKVIDGDEHDLRFKDGKAKCVGLVAKGRAKKDTSGFVRE